MSPLRRPVEQPELAGAQTAIPATDAYVTPSLKTDVSPLPSQRWMMASEKIFEKTMENAPAMPEAAEAQMERVTDLEPGRSQRRGERGRSTATQKRTKAAAGQA